jgi:hypothetical protein
MYQQIQDAMAVMTIAVDQLQPQKQLNAFDIYLMNQRNEIYEVSAGDNNIAPSEVPG